EFVAGSAAAQEVKWLRTIIQPIDPHVVAQPTELMIDNTGAAEIFAPIPCFRFRQKMPTYKMYVILFQEQRGGDGVDGRVTPPLVKESPQLVKVFCPTQ
ncbi:MAG: hypothetical protein BJ554DRAFT_564, partial [Olpidium bornovanus]